MIFIDNKYTRVYYAIIDRAQTRTIPKTFTEKHHVIPRSLGGSEAKSNLVVLTAREHFLCHWLLVKMTQGKAKRSMSHALRMMLAKNKRIDGRYIPKSKLYELIKKAANKASKGRPCTPETRQKIRQGNLNRPPITEATRKKLSEAAKRRRGLSEEGKRRISEANKKRVVTEEMKENLRNARKKQVERQGGTMTAEAREKLSRAAKGRKLTQEHVEKIASANRGKTRSKDFREAIAKRMLGHKKSQKTLQKLKNKASTSPKPCVTCPHCGKTGGAPSMKRWHFDNCPILTNK
jgi:5-methylcytosine-specific restriction endonuclease McrA